MSSPHLYRLAALCAVGGGLLRLASPFAPVILGERALQLSWLAIDGLLLFALIGLYGSRWERLGVTGLAGFVIAILGLLMVRSASAALFGPASYAVGASVWSVGQALFAAALLLNRAGLRTASILWLVSLALGLMASLIRLPTLHPLLDGVALAGMVFAAGYVAAGGSVLREPPATCAEGSAGR